MHPIYNNQRYYSLSNYYKRTFGARIMKAVIDGGFSCPNKDGTLSHKGCLFCDGGSGYFTHSGSVTEQLIAESKRIHAKYPDAKLIAYFQANTNTYAPIEKLKRLYEEAISFPDVVGLSIATRADCISDEILSYLKELSERTRLTVELGLQTIHKSTAEKMNLCCTRELIKKRTLQLKSLGIRVCLHIINGLPGESIDDMLETVNVASSWQPDGVKLQLLHVIKDTPLEQIYKSTGFHILTEEEYVDLIARQIRLLPPETVCERLTGDGDAKKLIAPMWSKNKRHVLNRIAQRLKETNSFQGDDFQLSGSQYSAI